MKEVVWAASMVVLALGLVGNVLDQVTKGPKPNRKALQFLAGERAKIEVTSSAQTTGNNLSKSCLTLTKILLVQDIIATICQKYSYCLMNIVSIRCTSSGPLTL